MKKSTLVILSVIIILSALLSACGNPCSAGNACGITAPAGDIQQTITQYVQDTCQKDSAGNCKTMGQ